ncbi:MAG: GTP-binding protein [Pseudomonadota bacterium]
MAKEKLSAIPTNVITGFLGVGKTTTILKLLEQKPAQERWAVLINEFGEIGVDGSLVQGITGDGGGIFLREVPGGCMCCAAGLPMQIALNQLLGRARPHRLLIEPTGLGHPIEVLQALSTEYYQELLALQKTLTLVDARNLSDPRYTSNTTFLQQLEVADLIVANKSDLYSPSDRAVLEEFINQHCSEGTEIHSTAHGQLELACLQGASAGNFEARSPHKNTENAPLVSDLPLPADGVLKAENKGSGFRSIGWRFGPAKVFDRDRLFSFLSGISVERVKAVFITHRGVFAYNMTRDALSEVELDDCMESRIEIIANEIDAEWEQSLTACLCGGS